MWEKLKEGKEILSNICKDRWGIIRLSRYFRIIAAIIILIVAGNKWFGNIWDYSFVPSGLWETEIRDWLNTRIIAVMWGWFIFDLVGIRFLLAIPAFFNKGDGTTAIPMIMTLNDIVDITCSTIMLGYAVNLLIEQKNNIGFLSQNIVIISAIYLVLGIFLRQYSFHRKAHFKNNLRKTNYYDVNGNCIYDGAYVSYYGKRYRIGWVLPSVPAYGTRQKRIWELIPDLSDRDSKTIALEDAAKDDNGKLTIIEETIIVS